MHDSVTQLLDEWRAGDVGARDRLVGVLYPELRRVAAQMFRSERADHTLQPTALVNEAWLRLSGSAFAASGDRRYLMATVARLMREILIDHARSRATAKRDGGRRVSVTEVDLIDEAAGIDLLGLDLALAKLERIDPLKARIVELRYFAGLSIDDTAGAVELSPATVKRHWQGARVWLFDSLGGEQPVA